MTERNLDYNNLFGIQVGDPYNISVTNHTFGFNYDGRVAGFEETESLDPEADRKLLGRDSLDQQIWVIIEELQGNPARKNKFSIESVLNGETQDPVIRTTLTRL